MIYYYKWRSAFLQVRKNYEVKVDAAKVIQNWAHNQESYDLRTSLCRWKDFVRQRGLQEEALVHMCGRKKVRGLREAFIKWLAEAQKTKGDNKY